jgi:hypothetical protein
LGIPNTSSSLLTLPAMTLVLTIAAAAAIVVILLASTVTIINAQQLEQLTSEPSEIQSEQ